MASAARLSTQGAAAQAGPRALEAPEALRARGAPPLGLYSVTPEAPGRKHTPKRKKKGTWLGSNRSLGGPPSLIKPSARQSAVKGEAETSAMISKSLIKCFIQEKNIKYVAISKHHGCVSVIRIGDAATAGSHLRNQIAYPVKASGRSKERDDTCPRCARGPWAFCSNKGRGCLPST